MTHNSHSYYPTLVLLEMLSLTMNELTATAKSFIDYDVQLHPGGEGKSKLVEVLTKFATGSKTIQRCGQVFNVAAVDAMQIVQNLTKSPDVKTFSNLAMVFCKEVNERVF